MGVSIMKWSIALLGFCLQAALATPLEERKGRISLFNIVKFKNDPCLSTSTITGAAGADATRTGTCLAGAECNDKTGVKAGGCAQGFGVCCVFMADTCNAVVSENCTYARTPAMIDGNQCSFSVQKCQQDICALRLDFVAFATLGPANTEEVDGGACRDAFVVTSDATGFTSPTLCGELTGQHIYVPMGPLSTATAKLELTLNAATDRRSFETKVSQIPCSSQMRPPDGCLQWYTGTDGQLTSFNFAANTGHLALQNYNICVRRESGFCCIRYGLSTCGLADATERYCGHQLADVKDAASSVEICDCTAPFAVGVVTDNMADANSAKVPNRGFCLNYVQTPCGTAVP